MNYKTVRPYIFKFFAIVFIAFSGHHLYEYFIPDLRPNYPPLRHIAFVFINLILAYVMIKRHTLITPFLFILAAQQTFAHGLNLHRDWTESNAVMYTDLAIIILMPALLITYVYDVHQTE